MSMHRAQRGGSRWVDQREGCIMGTVVAVCTSEIKGIQKAETTGIDLVADHGIEGDAHAGKWHRQVSLLAAERIQEFKDRGADVDNGAFGENIIVEGLGDLKSYPLGTRFTCGDAVLELAQIGKECHAHCAIYHAMGDCIMPREGVFCRVIEGGHVAPGSPIEPIV